MSIVVLFLLLVSCGDDSVTRGTDASTTTGSPPTSGPPDTTPETSSPVTTSVATTSVVTTSPVTTGPAANDLMAFGRATVPLDGQPMTVAVADTPELRAQGLMGVTDLVDVDGMLFVFDGDVEAAFWMKDTLIPLDIWFFAADGSFVDMHTMTPCEADPCDTYPASAPYRYALETEVGRLDAAASLDVGSIPG